MSKPVVLLTALCALVVLGAAATAPTAETSAAPQPEEPLDDPERCRVPPVQLLDPDRTETHLEFAPGALAFLRDPVRASRPVIPITVVGAVRTGKSFFLGMVTRCRTFFPLGHGIESKTRGARLFAMEPPTPVRAEDAAHAPLYLVIDTEGLAGGLATYDKAMLLFATLASSHMVYHLSQKINTEDVTRLYSIASLVKAFSRNQLVGALELPPVTWVVDQYVFEDRSREHPDYDLSQPDGVLRYLYSEKLCERPNPTEHRTIAEHNETVRVVRNEFRSHIAFFIHPAVDNSTQRVLLDTLPVSRMEKRYLAQIDRVRNELFATKPKHLRKLSHSSFGSSNSNNKNSNNNDSDRDRDRDGDVLTCSGFADYIEALLPVINDENFEFIGDRVVQTISQRAHAAALETYRRNMAQCVLPLDGAAWAAANATACDEAARIFAERVVPGGGAAALGYHSRAVYRALLADLLTESRLLARDNEDAAAALCRNVSAAAVARIHAAREEAGDDVIAFDRAAAAVVTGARAALRGPGTVACVAALQHEADHARRLLAVGAAPHRVLRPLCVAVAAFLVLNVVDSLGVLRAAPALAAAAKAAASLALCAAAAIVVALLGVVPALTPDAVMRVLDDPLALLRAVPPALVAVPALLVVLAAVAWAARPAPSTAWAARPRDYTRYVVRVRNCPSAAYATAVARALFDNTVPGGRCGTRKPVLVVGARRVLGLAFLPARAWFCVLVGPPSVRELPGGHRWADDDGTVVAVAQFDRCAQADDYANTVGCALVRHYGSSAGAQCTQYPEDTYPHTPLHTRSARADYYDGSMSQPSPKNIWK